MQYDPIGWNVGPGIRHMLVCYHYWLNPISPGTPLTMERVATGKQITGADIQSRLSSWTSLPQFLAADQFYIAHHTMHRCSDQNVGSPWTWWLLTVTGCFLLLDHAHWAMSLALQWSCKSSHYDTDHLFKKKQTNQPKLRNTVFLNCSRHWLVIRHWPFAWWMQRCTQTWVCSCLWRQLLIVAYSFIKWFVSLLMHSEERAIWTSWVSNLRKKSLIFSSTECVAGK